MFPMMKSNGVPLLDVLHKNLKQSHSPCEWVGINSI